MPNALSVEKKPFPIRSVQSDRGSLVPWEVAGYFEDFEKSKSPWGFFDLTHWEVVEMTGPDAADFLHRMSTANIKELAVSEVTYLAFLTGRANPVVFGYTLRSTEASFLLFFPAGQGLTALEHIEKFHFAENFESLRRPDLLLTGLWVPPPERDVETFFDTALPKQPLIAVETEYEESPLTVWGDDVRPELFWVMTPADNMEHLWAGFRGDGGTLVGQRLFEYYRLRAGVPEVGKEISEKEIFLEGNFERGVARNKGCYPGQEVIERIFTYGQVNKKLLPIELVATESFPMLPFTLHSAGQNVGTVVALALHPESANKAIALAYVGKAHWGLKTFDGPNGVEGHLGVRPASGSAR